LIEFIGKNIPYLIAGVGLVLFVLTITPLLINRKNTKNPKPIPATSASVFMNSVFDASPQSIIVINQAGQIIESNQALKVLTGYSNDELKSELLTKIAASFDLTSLNQQIPSPFSKEVELIHKSGEKLPYLFFLQPE